jgi:hypothetical protein
MGKILVLEDNEFMREHTSELLFESKYFHEMKYKVFGFRRIDQAKHFFSKEKDTIVCIVTDLNMSDEWLEGYRNESYGCILSGWVWLNRFVFPEKPDMPTVIYSGFLEELNVKIPSDQFEGRNIIQVAKGADDGEGFIGLLNAIKKVIERA